LPATNLEIDSAVALLFLVLTFSCVLFGSNAYVVYLGGGIFAIRALAYDGEGFGLGLPHLEAS
jgi:hypothetical protein